MGAPGEQGVNVSIFTDVSLLSDVLMVKDHVCSLRGIDGSPGSKGDNGDPGKSVSLSYVYVIHVSSCSSVRGSWICVGQ